MWLFKRDPGPCPVDDCPHHICVAPEAPEGVVVVTPRPPRDGPRQPRSAPRLIVRTASEFTTATYRREEHDPRRARKKTT
jgi:hypothetical protein